ncbi:MAG: PmoA family protein [Planctomycetota bacterium]|nr:PmoA family protein [Planctomycetota bacterium]
MQLRLLKLALLFNCLVAAQVLRAQDAKVTFEQHKDKITVLLNDSLFTEYVFAGYEKPILYPVIGPAGTSMTRDYPMKKDTPNEKPDHPHHKSIWFGHMKVNNESFWHVGKNAGTTEHVGYEIKGNSIHSKNKLVDRDGEMMAMDSRVIAFGGSSQSRWIDYTVTYHASESDLVFGDNKDGQMGIRMNAALRIAGPIATGKAINAEGVREKNIWGKRAPWIDYWGEIDGKKVGIAMFDHPTNLRHPTWWHARDYGLLSANPFGIHHFESKADGKAGEHTLKKGGSLTFRHRFLFHLGDYKSAGVAKAYKSWSDH